MMATQEQEDLKRVWAAMSAIQDQIDMLTKIVADLVACKQIVPVDHGDPTPGPAASAGV